MADFLRDFAIFAGSNAMLLLVTALALALIGLLFVAPSIEDAVSRSTVRGGNRPWHRYLAQLKLLRTPERGMKDQFTTFLYRDGEATSEMQAGTDFFFFVQVTTAVAFAPFAAWGMLTNDNSPMYLLLIPAGYFAPLLIAMLHNKTRAKKIERDMPIVVRRLLTQVSAEAGLRHAFETVAAMDDQVGPIFNEIDWAARRMRRDNPYDVLRDLAERTRVRLWIKLADQAERARERSEAKEREAIEYVLGEFLAERRRRKEEKAEKIVQRVGLTMTPFLLMGLLISLMSSFIINLLAGGGLTGV